MTHSYSQLLCLGLAILLVACTPPKKETPTVVSTIGMIHNLVQEIGQDHVTAVSLMGPGVDPHLYKASAGDVAILNNADVILYNGLHLESKLIDIFKKIGTKKPTYAVTKTMPKDQLIAPKEYDGFYDPHVWFDVTLWRYAVEQVTEALVNIAPEHKRNFLKNKTRYLAELDALDEWIQQQVSNIPPEHRTLVTAHDAFGYFGKRYKLTVVGLQGISTVSEANTKDIQAITQIIIDNAIPTIFIESSVPVRQINAVKAAVMAKGHTVAIGQPLFTDAMGSAGTPEGTYIGMIKHNVNSIVNGLK
jgi:manganese/zinc/iron transport system substrate-binding protein